jgi:hypothetical protein
MQIYVGTIADYLGNATAATAASSPRTHGCPSSFTISKYLGIYLDGELQSRYFVQYADLGLCAPDFADLILCYSKLFLLVNPHSAPSITSLAVFAYYPVLCKIGR